MPTTETRERERAPRAWTTWLLLATAVAIAVLPLVIGAGRHLEQPYAGADSKGEEAVTQLDPGYQPWFSPLYEAPSGEVESGLFALQAAIGAGVVGYSFGVVRTRNRLRRADREDREPAAGDD